MREKTPLDYPLKVGQRKIQMKGKRRGRQETTSWDTRDDVDISRNL